MADILGMAQQAMAKLVPEKQIAPDNTEGVQKQKHDFDKEVQDYIKRHEGWRETLYVDPTGKAKSNKAIGWGYNVNDPVVRQHLPMEVVTGKRPIKKDEAQKIFQELYNTAKQNAIDYVGQEYWEKLTPSQRKVLIDMSYNLGGPKLRQFRKMRQAIIDGDIQRAAKEMQNSNWYRQVKSRGRENVTLFLGGKK